MSTADAASDLKFPIAGYLEPTPYSRLPGNLFSKPGFFPIRGLKKVFLEKRSQTLPVFIEFLKKIKPNRTQIEPK
jgi:hypothetical protein